MDLDYSDDQRMLKEMVDRFVADRYDFDTRMKFLRAPAPVNRDTWREMAELGLLMATVPEADGGMSGGGVAAMIIGEAFGRAMVAEPFMASAIMATAALADAPDDIRRGLLALAMDGTSILAVVIDASLAISDGRLSGTAPVVIGGHAADMLLVFATGQNGALHLLTVEANAVGVHRDAYPLHGGIGAADIRFDGAVATAVAGPDIAADMQVRAQDAAIAWLVAEGLGAAQGAFDLTMNYLKTRIQFGKTLGANQALQHRAADMLVELEQLRSAAIYAAMMLDEPDTELRAKGLSAAKIVLCKSARFVAQQTVQLHGGIGVTEDYAAGHYFRRLTALTLLLGDSDFHVDALAARGGFTGPEPYWP
jgi:alkylation response protein AidB-like acyl-CoA dehydrogenase